VGALFIIILCILFKTPETISVQGHSGRQICPSKDIPFQIIDVNLSKKCVRTVLFTKCFHSAPKAKVLKWVYGQAVLWIWIKEDCHLKSSQIF
jgi:hypothetical protein